MTETIRFGLPARLPKFDWAGNDRDWSGQPIRWSDAQDLPVAYLTATLQRMNPDVVFHFVGSQANAQGMPVRRPNVLMCTADVANEILASQSRVDRLDRLGVIVCSLMPGPFLEDLSGGRALLTGLPGDIEEGPIIIRLRPPEQYIGGRLLVVMKQISDGNDWVGDYIDFTFEEVLDYQTPLGSQSQCERVSAGVAGQHLRAGTSPVAATFDSGGRGLGYTLVNNGLIAARVSEDKAFLEEAAARFDKIKIALSFFDFNVQNYPVAVKMSCMRVDNETGADIGNDAFQPEGSDQNDVTLPGTNQAIVDGYENVLQPLILSTFAGPIVVDGDVIGPDDYVAFFEEP